MTAKSMIEEAAAHAEAILRSIAPSAACVPQEWDGRVDCVITLEDGTVVGEMIPVDELTDERLEQTAKRLRMRTEGFEVRLIGELRVPRRIIPNRES